MSGPLEAAFFPGEPSILRVVLSFEKQLLREGILLELQAFLEDVSRQPGVEGIVFVSEKPGLFLAGADMAEMLAFSSADALCFSKNGQRLFEIMARSPLALAAAVDGACRGGGMDFLLACDAVLATPASTFAHGGAKLGLMTGFGGTVRLPKKIGEARALEWFTSARVLNAGEAVEARFLDSIVEAKALESESLAKVRALIRDPEFHVEKPLREFSPEAKRRIAPRLKQLFKLK